MGFNQIQPEPSADHEYILDRGKEDDIARAAEHGRMVEEAKRAARGQPGKPSFFQRLFGRTS